MARNLEQLQKQYGGSMSKGKKAGSAPAATTHRGGGPGMRISIGKPKNTSKTIKRLFAYVEAYKFRLFFVLISILLSTTCSLAGSYMLLPLINRIAQVPTEAKDGFFAVKADQIIEKAHNATFPLFEPLFQAQRHTDILIYVLTGVIILLSIYLIGIAASYIQARIMLSVSQGSLERIRNELFVKLQKLPVKYYDSHPTGDVMSRFTNDVDNIGGMLDNSLVSIISGIITLIGTFILMLVTNLTLTAVMVVFIPILIFTAKKIGQFSVKYYSAQQSALGAINGYIEETVSGQKVIKVFNRENECISEMGTLNEDLRDKQFKAQFFGGIMGPVMGNIGQISFSVTVGVGGLLMLSRGFTPGGMTLFAGYARQFAFPINNISMQISSILSALAGAERVFEVMDQNSEVLGTEKSVRDVEIKGNVEFENVTFGYVEGKTVLKNISLYAKPGQKIAFVGSTGAGKTTITNLINRFYEINSGEITVDGVSVKEYDLEFLRKNIAMVLQDTHLFSGTVMENIRYGRLDATDEEVISAAKTASAHSFIMRLSDGYKTMLEGDGANLSQGQRQLLNIARASLSKAPILVLDEATSSVDTRTERLIEMGMDKLMENRTTFVIAHRLSTVRNSNAIMVLENGEIIERGTHEQLLEMKGRYYELHTGKIELD